MSYTREQWCKDFLTAIGNTSPSTDTLNWIIGWTKIESAPPGAMYNLLNTTQHMPGSTNFNSVGVQNFVSYAQGIDANRIVLENGLYPALLAALRTDDTQSLGINATHTVSSNIAANLNVWCGGCNYAAAILKLVGIGSLDSFPGTATPAVPAINYRAQAAHDTWFSNGLNLPYNTAIAQEWTHRYIHEKIMHSPDGPEFDSRDWVGVPIKVQEFGPDRLERNKNTLENKWYRI